MKGREPQAPIDTPVRMRYRLPSIWDSSIGGGPFLPTMAYFHESHEQIRYTHASDGRHGLRTSQIGALHAISSHFTIHERRAVVVLPTGAGKTAVLMLTPYMA